MAGRGIRRHWAPGSTRGDACMVDGVGGNCTPDTDKRIRNDASARKNTCRIHPRRCRRLRGFYHATVPRPLPDQRISGCDADHYRSYGWAASGLQRRERCHHISHAWGPACSSVHGRSINLPRNDGSSFDLGTRRHSHVGRVAHYGAGCVLSCGCTAERPWAGRFPPKSEDSGLHEGYAHGRGLRGRHRLRSVVVGFRTRFTPG
mmetsp:Transcript_10025/g.25969  ORF Transcript_10025/g.25969 Transcript_10025/m.25969 type:complete len:204 (-) Transcript_10025:113-724(-)